MTKKGIEICIISAHGLSRSSSLWKPQWFAVGWIEPNNKYCTKVDKSGSINPSWNAEFSVLSNDMSLNLQGLSLTIEVYRRETIFYRDKLRGAASISLKEFFAKFRNGEAASFQLRKKKSSKAQGFVDVSIRVSEENEGGYSHSGFGEGFYYSDSKSDIPLSIEDGPVASPPNQFGDHTYNNSNYPNIYPTSNPKSSQNQTVATGDRYGRPPTPPPPPPPSHTGFLPTLFPEATLGTRPSGFGMGLGDGALAAGAMIFGDDFLSGSSFPMGLRDGSGTTISDDNRQL